MGKNEQFDGIPVKYVSHLRGEKNRWNEFNYAGGKGKNAPDEPVNFALIILNPKKP